MKKLLAAILSLTLCVTTSSSVFAGGRDYTDYNDANLSFVLTDQSADLTQLYFEIEANHLHNMELFDGISSATYKPALDEYATREQAMKLMAVAFDWPIDMEALSGFSDVAPWAEPYVAAAVAQNATNGIGNGLFGATQAITAHEMYTMVLRSLGYTGPDIWNATSEYTERALSLQGYPHATQDDPINRDRLVGIIFLALVKGEAKGEHFTLLEKIAMHDDILASVASTGGLISRNYLKDSNGLSLRESLTDISPLFTTISTSALPYHSAIKHLGDLGYVPLTYKIGSDKSYYEIAESKLVGDNTLELSYRFGQLYFTMKDGDISLKSIKIDEAGYFAYKGIATDEEIYSAEGLIFNGDTVDYDTNTRYYTDPALKAYINTTFGDGLNIFEISPMTE